MASQEEALRGSAAGEKRLGQTGRQRIGRGMYDRTYVRRELMGVHHAVGRLLKKLEALLEAMSNSSKIAA